MEPNLPLAACIYIFIRTDIYLINNTIFKKDIYLIEITKTKGNGGVDGGSDCASYSSRHQDDAIACLSNKNTLFV